MIQAGLRHTSINWTVHLFRVYLYSVRSTVLGDASGYVSMSKASVQRTTCSKEKHGSALYGALCMEHFIQTLELL